MNNKPSLKKPVTTGRSPSGRRVGPTTKIVSAFVVIAILAVAGVTLANRGSSPQKSKRLPGSPGGDSAAGRFHFAVGNPGPGQEAPAIVLPSTNGEIFDLGFHHGKGVLLYFQEGIGCQPCWDQMRDYATAAASFKAAGVDEFVTITSNPVSLLARKMRQDGIGGIVLADTDLGVSRAYHANDYGMMGNSTDGHSFVFVDAKGIIRWRADYGGSPDFTMYVPPANLLADLRAGLRLTR